MIAQSMQSPVMRVQDKAFRHNTLDGHLLNHIGGIPNTQCTSWLRSGLPLNTMSQPLLDSCASPSWIFCSVKKGSAVHFKSLASDSIPGYLIQPSTCQTSSAVFPRVRSTYELRARFVRRLDVQMIRRHPSTLYSRAEVLPDSVSKEACLRPIRQRWAADIPDVGTMPISSFRFQ
ncbi:hypothetical protein VTK26DRAFT_2406 [Humicola hyalothermophila]